MKKNLAKLKKVDLRDVWGNEATDFTNWLAQPENLDLLSEEIGVAIKLIQPEASVGEFKVDLLAEEESSGRSGAEHLPVGEGAAQRGSRLTL